jgi:hypothetical protein
LKIKKAASPNASTDVCTVDYFEHHIQNRLLPLGMLNKEHANPARPVSLSLFMFENLKRPPLNEHATLESAARSVSTFFSQCTHLSIYAFNTTVHTEFFLIGNIVAKHA